MFPPQFEGRCIASSEELHSIIDQHRSELVSIEGLSRFTDSAEKHLELYRRIGQRDFLEYGEIARLARELDMNTAQVRGYAFRGAIPELYSIMGERARVEGSEGRMVELHIKWPEVRGSQIHAESELMSLLHSEYSTLSEKADFDERRREAVAHLSLCEQYCGLSAVPEGELARIARRIGVDPETASNWMTKGMRPRLTAIWNGRFRKARPSELFSEYVTRTTEYTA